MVLMIVQSSIFYMTGCSTTSFVPLITAVSFRSRKIRDNFHILRLVSRPQHIIVWLPRPPFYLVYYSNTVARLFSWVYQIQKFK